MALDRERRTPPRVLVDGSRGNARVFWREWRAGVRPCVGDGRGTRSRPARDRQVARLTFGATECDEAIQRRSLISRFSFVGFAARWRDALIKSQRDPKSDTTQHLSVLNGCRRAIRRARVSATDACSPTVSDHRIGTQRARLVSPRVQPRASPRRSSLERVASPAGSLADRVTSQTNARRWAEVAKRPRPPAPRPRCVSDLPRTPLRAALVAASRSPRPPGSSRGRDDRRRRARPRRSRGDVTV
jgi:hypothetical protein